MIEFKEAKRRFKEALRNPEYRDERVIKPESFLYSDFVKFIFKGEPVYYTKRVEREARLLGARLLLDRPMKVSLRERRSLSISGYTEDETHYDAEFYPVKPRSKTLVHTNVYVNYGSIVTPKARIPNLDKQANRGVIGRRRREAPTFLSSPRLKREVGLAQGAYRTHLKVDVEELLRYRTIFHDPGGLVLPQEYRKTFIVFGGIPVQAIVDFEMVEDC